MKILAAMMILCSSLLYAKAKRFEFNSQVGVVDATADGKLCLIISNATLAEGTVVNLVTASNRQSSAKAVIKQKLRQTCSYNPDTGDASFYLVTLNEKNTVRFKDRQAAAIAIVSRAPVHVHHGKVSVDLDKDGRREFFRECTSNEGVHFTVWTGKPLQGKRRWHFYYYLGYDVVPSCNKRDHI